MAGNLPSRYIKAYGITKEAWKKFRADKKKKTDRYKKTYKGKTTKQTQRSKRVPRRRYRRKRKRRTRTIPLLPIAGFVASTNAFNGWNKLRQGNFQGYFQGLIAGYTGYKIEDGSFNPARMREGLLPVVAGVLVHKGLSMLGVNRYFSNLPSPLNKIRL